MSIVIIKPLSIVFHHLCDTVDQVTGVYTTNTTEAVHYQLKHSMTNIAVVDGKAQLEKVDVGKMIDNHDHVDDGDDDVPQVLAVRDKLPDLRAIVQYGPEEVHHDGVVSWEDFQVIITTINMVIIVVVIIFVLIIMMVITGSWLQPWR